METVLSRYRNLIVLVAVLFAQVLGLAVQVKRSATASEPTRLIRVWAVNAVTPFEQVLHWTQSSSTGLWHNYLYLRGVRAENRELKQEIQQMKLEEARMSQDAGQAHRLQALLGFKEQFISQTMAAQVIGGSGSEQSRSIFIDKGAREGIKPDMAVITKDGVVGKVLQVYGTNALERSVSQVLLIDDQTSGVGAILEKTRLQGILRGMPSGEVVLEKVMSDETVSPGEQVLTSGGDGIFPKGLPVGTVTRVTLGSDLFLNIRVRPAANLDRLEEVLVVTKIDDRQAQPEQEGPIRAADILAERLPSVPQKTGAAADAGKTGAQPGVTTAAAPSTSPSGSHIPSAAPLIAAPIVAAPAAKAALGVGGSAPKPSTLQTTVPGASASPTNLANPSANPSANPPKTNAAKPALPANSASTPSKPPAVPPSNSSGATKAPGATVTATVPAGKPVIKPAATTPAAKQTTTPATASPKPVSSVTAPNRLADTTKPQPPSEDASH